MKEVELDLKKRDVSYNNIETMTYEDLEKKTYAEIENEFYRQPPVKMVEVKLIEPVKEVRL